MSKQEARPDEDDGIARGTSWLSQDFSVLAEQCADPNPPVIYDLVIVGSGYGGAMAAAELAGKVDAEGKPMTVCVLERGREYLPGMFPSRLSELPAHVRFSLQDGLPARGRREGLFDFRVGSDVSALVGNGLGGGSLINGAVMEVPKFNEFSGRRLPPDVVADLMNGWYDEAKVLLGAASRASTGAVVDNTIGLHGEVVKTPLKKRVALEALARQAQHAKVAKASSRDAAITIEMEAQPADGNLRQCTLCGDCMTGCNVGARRSLDTNLLVRASAAGAHIFTCVCVLHLARTAVDGGDPRNCWKLELAHTDKGLDEKRGGSSFIFARKVILAAGTLGSTELLLRSQGDNLKFSPRLGEQFSCNGDNLAAIHKVREDARPHAAETDPLMSGSRHVGPTITGVIDMKPGGGGPGFLLQEFAVPAPLARLFGELVTTGDAINALPDWDKSTHRAGAKGRDPLAVDPDAMAKTMLVGVIGHDASIGKLQLPADYVKVTAPKKRAHEGSIKIAWDRAAEDGAVKAAFATFEKAASALGRVVPNPVWRLLPPDLQALAGKVGGGMLTVHPLGGCAMGTGWRDGVVDEYGAVWDLRQDAKDLWEGSLLVLDGSILPGSLGANPALTIAALSLRAARYWRKEWKWKTDRPVPAVVGARRVYRVPEKCTDTTIAPTRLQVMERLTGAVTLGADRRRYQLELTLAFQPKPLAELAGEMSRVLPLDHVRDDTEVVNRVRLFELDTWVAKRLDMKEDERDGCALVDVEVDGTLSFLDREPSLVVERVVRAGIGYLANRGLRDLWQSLFKPRDAQPGDPLWLTVWKGVKLASRAGEVRRFDYALEVTKVRTQTDGAPSLRPGDRIHSVKRFTYQRRANPWNQLLYLDILRFPGLESGHPAPSLKLDAGFLARKGVALARITSQQNQPVALAELASFGLYFTRLMLYIHLWSFRAPDAPSQREPQRLPGIVPGLPPPEIQEIDLITDEEAPARVRLTRYAQRTKPHLPPLVMIHGYSASGTTFAHPALEMSMARYFHERGRDVWILDLRTSAGMPTATQFWRFEQVATSDIPQAIERIVQQVSVERGVPEAQLKVDVFAHCVGAVMFSMAVLSDPAVTRLHTGDARALERLPSRVNKIVLSQKGMALAYTDANVLRAYVLRFLRPLLLPNGYTFRPPAQPSAADQLLDRFLAALPYPPDEFDLENPIRPCARTPWSATRHRMDALYERTFSLKNLSAKVLEHIDDFFGPLNVDTVSQTIHLARRQAITNNAGRNVFVNAAALQRWPRQGTLSIHGEENGMVDNYTLELMRKTMARAGVPFAEKLFLRMGHQDSLIGRDAVAVFAEVHYFLAGPVPPVPVKEVPASEFGVPWLGPRLHVTPSAGREMSPNGTVRHGKNEVRLLIGADPGRGETLAIVVPVTGRVPGEFVATGLPPGYRGVWLKPYDGWIALTLPCLESEEGGFLVLCRATYPGDSEWNPLGVGLGPLVTREAIQKEINRLGAEAGKAFVSGRDIARARPPDPTGAAVPDRMQWVLASCQYPAGILDGAPARESLDCLAKQVETDQPGVVLMVGDQIYADATAGLLDPSRKDDMYGRNYEDWLRTTPLRRIMQRVPVQMMLDDHEIADNWEPGLVLQDRQLHTAISSYWRWQRGAVRDDATDHLWFCLDLAGFEVFVSDTRSERAPRAKPAPYGHAALMNPAQHRALGDWLTRQHRRDLPGSVRPKFLVTGTWLAPRHLGAPGWAGAPGRSDAWDGYQGSMHELLGHIASEGIRGVVVLSGDAHLGCFAELTVRLKGPGAPAGVRVICISTPAMYAPFPFANAREQDYLTQETFAFKYKGVDCECEVATTSPMETGQGFTVLDLQRKGPGWELRAEIRAADRNSERVWSFA